MKVQEIRWVTGLFDRQDYNQNSKTHAAATEIGQPVTGSANRNERIALLPPPHKIFKRKCPKIENGKDQEHKPHDMDAKGDFVGLVMDLFLLFFFRLCHGLPPRPTAFHAPAW